MRIGIITFHAAHNYGAVLQCYALQAYLQKMGHDVSVLDYRNERLLDAYKCFNIKRFVRKNPFYFCRFFIEECYYYIPRKKRSIQFNRFIENTINQAPLNTIETNPFDLIIIGSDQVWNINLTYGYDPYYWGCFAHPECTKIASYAASMQDTWSESENAIIVEHLKNFDYLSVRESSLQRNLQSLTSKKIIHVVDPTLLLTTEEWKAIASRPKIRKPYLLLYQVDYSDHNVEIARRIAKDRGLKLIVLSADVSDDNSMSVRGCSPFDYVGLFLYADFVVCSSFHGTIFSLLFRKPFFSLKNKKGKNERVASLLASLCLEDHYIDDFCSSDGSYCFDENRFSIIINESKKYLKTITGIL